MTKGSPEPKIRLRRTVVLYLLGFVKMIELTKLNGTVILVNSDIIEIVEETPDTVITLTTGRKIIVKESRQEVKNLVKLYKRDVYAQ